MTIHINIGSNLGDRAGYIAAAVSKLCDLLHGECKVSEPFESEPWGYDSSNRFMNVGVMIDIDEPLAPEEILDRLQQAEKAVDAGPHRDESGKYVDRCVDIDLIAVDDIVCDTPRLTLPHPRMHLREFVLAPLAQLDPRWRHPV
ncbi:MAG: 2-amino-4-hydroxy-6-hydroxymethyldihydropteridine diphosphokinase, partial [Duncaniella sp.]|nr:2-amino-4-hydroxy-6-hydroxymethyldihydropteridine diphosphokinase [Duncaniella sp.]